MALDKKILPLDMDVPGLDRALKKLLVNFIASGNPSWLSCSFARLLERSSPFCFVLFLCMYTQAEGTEGGSAECVSMCIKLKAAVEESVMLPAWDNSPLHAGLNVFCVWYLQKATI